MSTAMQIQLPPLSVRERLDVLLSESVQSALQREQTAFDGLTAPYENRLVLSGAGGLGRRTLRGLREVDLEPLAFTDNNSSLWGQSVEGVPVLSPTDAVARFGNDATFVVTVWNTTAPDRMPERVSHLKRIGCRQVIPAGYLFWKFPEVFLPYYSLDLPHKLIHRADEVRLAFSLMADQRSREEYLGQIAFRLRLDFSALGSFVAEEQYFPPDIVRLRNDELFVDCGAYDGDTVETFIERSHGNFRRIIAFEPDPANWGALQQRVSEMPEAVTNRIHLIRAAVGAASGKLSFSCTGTAASAAGNGSASVDCLTLDDTLRHQAPTFIKFDIEGAEPEALAGVRQAVAQHRPILAVCAYHCQSHIWELPLSLSHAFDGYRIFIRPHSCDAWDLVCYAIPEERLISSQMPAGGPTT